MPKSGTNVYHGELFEFWRDNVLNANNWGSTLPTPPLRRNQFGGTFGGPIIKDKTFFFGYYEGFRNRQGESVPATVPSVAETQGNFGQLCTSISGDSFASSGANAGNCVNSQGNPDPNGQLTLFGQNVPFNQMTTVMPIDPTAAQAVSLFPAVPSGNAFIATETKNEDNNQFGIRLDHYLTTSDTLNFRYIYSSGPTTDPLSPVGANVPGFPVGEYDRAQNFVAQETHVFSHSVIGLARFSYLRNTFLLDEHLNHESP